MSDRTRGHDRMTQHVIDELTSQHAEDPATTAARSAVTIARARLDHIRRQFTRRQAGNSDVATAEHQLSAALDELDRVTRAAGGTAWR